MDMWSFYKSPVKRTLGAIALTFLACVLFFGMLFLTPAQAFTREQAGALAGQTGIIERLPAIQDNLQNQPQHKQTPLAQYKQLPLAASVGFESREVVLASNQTSFSLSVTIERELAYAGGELAIQCAPDVSVSAVTYRVAEGSATIGSATAGSTTAGNATTGSSVGPTVTDGLTWMSYFSGSNDYHGAVIATLTFHYAKADNTSIVLDHLNIFTNTGATVQRETLDVRQTIAIKRAGATNEPPALERPDELAPGNQAGNEAGNQTGQGGAGSSALVALSLEGNNDDAAGNAAANAADGAKTGDTAQGLSTLLSEATPLAQNAQEAQAADHSSQTGSNDFVASALSNPLFWILLVLSITFASLFGYAFIKQKQSH